MGTRENALTGDPPASVPQRRRMDDNENPFRPVAVESSRPANGRNSPFRDVEDDLNTDLETQLEETHLDEEDEQQDETQLEEDNEDSQPVRAGRKSDGLKGPHPPASSGVPDSVNATRDDERMDEDHSDVGEPFDDNVALDVGGHSDEGEPFDDNELEPMDYGDDGPQPLEDDDDVDLEEQAIADENAEGDFAEEGDSVELPTEKAKRGTKRTGTATPQKKVKRKSQISGEQRNQYEGDFLCRRSGRAHFKPLEWWRGERKEYTKGEYGPEIAGIVRVPEPVVVKPRATSRKGRGRGRGRSQTGRLQSASAAPPEEHPGMEHLDMDSNIDTMVTVKDYTTGEEVVRSRCAFSSYS